MKVKIQIPDDVAAQIQSNGGDLPRNVLEAYALEGYKSGQLSDYQVQEILGFETPMEVDGFLKSHGVYLDENRGRRPCRQPPREFPTPGGMIVVLDISPLKLPNSS